MEYDFGTLNILAEVTTAFVAFAVIVASIRLTIGQELTRKSRSTVLMGPVGERGELTETAA